jgi:crossover junction endodeoxyribonuclease RusA
MSVAECIGIHLPMLPPSVNSLYRNVPGRGRVKTDKYKDWLLEAGLIVNTQLKSNERIEGPYGLRLRAYRPDKRRRDLSNLLKATEDLLVALGVVEDDSLCQSIEAEWAQEQMNTGIKVWLISTKERP